MRGDSLRDLYAKGLALLGLAALAGVGALFDYWPLASDLPGISRAPLVQAPTLTSIAVPHLTSVATGVVGPAARRRGSRPMADQAASSAAAATSDRATSVPVADLRMPVPMVGASLGAGALVGSMTLAAPADANVTAPVVLADPEETMSRPLPPASATEALTTAAPIGDNASAVGFVTGALKKTGQTIMKTGVRTGASIRDAFVFFGGAFRKIL